MARRPVWLALEGVTANAATMPLVRTVITALMLATLTAAAEEPLTPALEQLRTARQSGNRATWVSCSARSMDCLVDELGPGVGLKRFDRDAREDAEWATRLNANTLAAVRKRINRRQAVAIAEGGLGRRGAVRTGRLASGAEELTFVVTTSTCIFNECTNAADCPLGFTITVDRQTGKVARVTSEPFTPSCNP